MRSLWAIVTLCVALTITGVALMFVYAPSTTPVVLTAAQKASSGLRAGYVLRGLHFWAAQVVLLVMLAHGVQVLTARAYRPLTAGKVSGLLTTSVLVGLLWFTGMMLPWDQLTYWLAQWSAKYGVHLTLLELYKMHVYGLPVLLAMALTVHLRSLTKTHTKTNT